jgi:hypothetical protein
VPPPPAPASADDPSAAKATDVVTNDHGELDLADTQYLLFNIVTFIYVAAVFISRIWDRSVVDPAVKWSLPDVPPVLLALSGASAATYAANKAATKSAPGISSLSNPRPKAGDLVTISGVNLVPPGSDVTTILASTRVVIHAIPNGRTPPTDVMVAVSPVPTPTAKTIAFTMPPGFQGFHLEIKVATAGNAVTPAYPAEGT